MKDMITLFNQLTSRKLADYNLFAQIVDNHYEKFKYLYYMISKLDFGKIDTIICDMSDSVIHVDITAKDNKYINTIIYTINNRKLSYKKAEFFLLDISEKGGTLTLSIGMVDDIREGELYADRFI